MLNTLKDLFDSFTQGTPGTQSPAERDHAVQLAAAVLLVEVMRAEPSMDAAERSAVITALRERFALAHDELERLVELAVETSQSAYDYQRFTSSLNDNFTHPEKTRLIEAMWQVAYADAHIDAHENHTISKVAGLLHVTHGEYIAAKLHAKQAADLAR